MPVAALGASDWVHTGFLPIQGQDLLRGCVFKSPDLSPDPTTSQSDKAHQPLVTGQVGNWIHPQTNRIDFVVRQGLSGLPCRLFLRPHSYWVQSWDVDSGVLVPNPREKHKGAGQDVLS